MTKKRQFRFEVSRLQCRPALREDRTPCVRIMGFTDMHGGVYVEVPIDAYQPLVVGPDGEVDAVNRTMAAMRAADLQNAFDTMAWIATEPDVAAADGMITAEQAAVIKRYLQPQEKAEALRQAAAALLTARALQKPLDIFLWNDLIAAHDAMIQETP